MPKKDSTAVAEIVFIILFCFGVLSLLFTIPLLFPEPDALEKGIGFMVGSFFMVATLFLFLIAGSVSMFVDTSKNLFIRVLQYTSLFCVVLTLALLPLRQILDANEDAKDRIVSYNRAVESYKQIMESKSVDPILITCREKLVNEFIISEEHNRALHNFKDCTTSLLLHESWSEESPDGKTNSCNIFIRQYIERKYVSRYSDDALKARELYQSCLESEKYFEIEEFFEKEQQEQLCQGYLNIIDLHKNNLTKDDFLEICLGTTAKPSIFWGTEEYMQASVYVRQVCSRDLYNIPRSLKVESGQIYKLTLEEAQNVMSYCLAEFDSTYVLPKEFYSDYTAEKL